MKRVSILGAGTWGTALAITLAKKGHPVEIWAYEKEVADCIRMRHENEIYLPGIKIPLNVSANTDLGRAVAGADIVLTVMPSHVCRPVMEKLRPHAKPEMIFVSATKGIDGDRLMRVSEIIREVLGPGFEPRFGVLSGPSFAREVALGDPTAVVVASEDRDLAELIQAEFSSATFRLYTSTDVVGVEMAGAVKNVIAIAAGVVAGLGLGHNPMAALLTRGLAEMTRLACACGARRETLAGLAGLGDLALTCTGDLSRNRKVGIELGKGRKLPDIVSSMRMVAEGVKTTSATRALAQRHGVDVPITQQVHRILEGDVAPREAIRELMERTLKKEE
jgi:glycerol-3-phosphate dehydrogenase (NAD(P)+)